MAAIAQAADAKTRQAEIDAAAQEYTDKQRSDADRIAELERAQKDEDNVPTDPTKPAGCKPAGIFYRSVREARCRRSIVSCRSRPCTSTLP